MQIITGKEKEYEDWKARCETTRKTRCEPR
jgi:hypothetical protein